MTGISGEKGADKHEESKLIDNNASPSSIKLGSRALSLPQLDSNQPQYQQKATF